MSGVSTSSASARDHSASLPDKPARPHNLIVMDRHAAAEVHDRTPLAAIADHAAQLTPALSAEPLQWPVTDETATLMA